MTLATGNRRGEASHSGAWGVTLIELLLVMALLMIVVSVSVPSLASFFRGRTLDSEGRRMLSLARHAQSRAVSEGVPMLLWFDPDEKTYGLEEEPGYVEKDPKAVQFTLDSELQMEAIEDRRFPAARQIPGRSMSGSSAGLSANPTMLAESTRKNLPQVRFMPDGFADYEAPAAIRIWDRTGSSLWLARSTNRLNFELRSEYNP